MQNPVHWYTGDLNGKWGKRVTVVVSENIPIQWSTVTFDSLRHVMLAVVALYAAQDEEETLLMVVKMGG